MLPEVCLCVCIIFIYFLFSVDQNKRTSMRIKHTLYLPHCATKTRRRNSLNNWKSIYSIEFFFPFFQKSFRKGEILIFILRNGSMSRGFLPSSASAQNFVDRPNAICRFSCAWTKYRSFEFDCAARTKHYAVDDSLSHSNFDR